jgi:uncharacterized repeat protein (TIGR04076 family)
MMYELKVTAKKVMGTCTADPQVEVGDYFTVRDGDLRIPEGGFVCIWALQAMLPVLTPKERAMAEDDDEDWMHRVHHVQCPDPNGRVIYKIERTVKIEKKAGDPVGADADDPACKPAAEEPVPQMDGGVRSLQIVVEEVKGKCTSCMKPGDHFRLQSGRIYIPPDGHFCLYALHATLPLLPARQRPLEDGDWMKEEGHVICPDPAGNVIMRIEPTP